MSRIHTRILTIALLLFILAFLASPAPAHAAGIPGAVSIVAQTGPTPPPSGWANLGEWLRTNGAVAFVVAILSALPIVSGLPEGWKTAASLAIAGVFGVLAYAFGQFTPDQAMSGQKLWDILKLILELFTGGQIAQQGARSLRYATFALIAGRPAAYNLMDLEMARKSIPRVKAVG